MHSYDFSFSCRERLSSHVSFIPIEGTVNLSIGSQFMDIAGPFKGGHYKSYFDSPSVR